MIPKSVLLHFYNHLRGGRNSGSWRTYNSAWLNNCMYAHKSSKQGFLPNGATTPFSVHLPSTTI